MQFLSDVNFNKNDLQNAKIENLSSAPSNPVLGQVYFNTTSKNLFCYNLIALFFCVTLILWLAVNNICFSIIHNSIVFLIFNLAFSYPYFSCKHDNHMVRLARIKTNFSVAKIS